MRRHLLGLIALACLVLAAVVVWCPSLKSYQVAGAMGLRIGSVLAVLWLAWPDLHRLPSWAWYVLPIALLALFYAKTILIYLSPAFAVAIVAYVMYRKIWRSPR